MADVYEIITNQFIEALEKGVVPWRQPWTAADAPRNYVSHKNYRGGNLFLLHLSAIVKGYTSPEWMTYKQATALGGQVRKGEKSTEVYFWKPSKYAKKDAKTDEETTHRSLLLRYYNVFNVAQIDGLPAREVKEIAELQKPADLWNAWTGKPPVKHGGVRASYSSSQDRIQMPLRNSFGTSEAYYATLFHEGVHSTGHESRLDRGFAFSGDGYAKEELVAEIGAAFLCAECGIDTPEIEGQAQAYVANWLKALKNDSKLILSAASHAQRAADSILGRVIEYTNTTEEDGGAEDSAVTFR
jgi:antirestriction protein ArdC